MDGQSLVSILVRDSPPNLILYGPCPHISPTIRQTLGINSVPTKHITDLHIDIRYYSNYIEFNMESIKNNNIFLLFKS